MIQRTIRASVLLSGAALILASGLHASTVKSEKFQVPFSFSVHGHTLPAGQYQIQQATESEFAVLLNTKTGERVEILRPASIRRAGNAQLVFGEDREMHVLRRIS